MHFQFATQWQDNKTHLTFFGFTNPETPKLWDWASESANADSPEIRAELIRQAEAAFRVSLKETKKNGERVYVPV